MVPPRHRQRLRAAALHRTRTPVAEGTITDQEMTGVAGRPRPALARYRLATSAPRTSSGFQSRWQTVRGVDIHDRASLSGANVTPPLVLVHGLAVSHRYLMPLAARLAGHHPVHVVDLPGFGLSSDPRAPAFSRNAPDVRFG